MLESMKSASFALMKTITPSGAHHNRQNCGSAKGPAHRRRESAPVRCSTRPRAPVIKSPLDGIDIGSPSKRPLFEENMNHKDHVAAKRRKTTQANPPRRSKNLNTDILSAEDVTEDMLTNVSDFVSEKIYNKVTVLFLYAVNI
jgi:hypothetical protein